MDWFLSVMLALAFAPFIQCWSVIPSRQSIRGRQRNEVSPYLDIVLCPLREEPWSCARQQSGRILDVWDNELHSQWQRLKVEADQQLNSTIEKRGYSANEIMTKEKPSTILKKIEIGTNYMKEYLAETMDGFLGREYEYAQNFKNHNQVQSDDETDKDEEQADEQQGEDDEEEEEEEEEEEAEGDLKNTDLANDNFSSGNEFIDIEDTNDEQTIGQLKKPGGGNQRRKKKKGDGIATQAANLLIIQPLEHQLTQSGDNGHNGKPIKTKRKPMRQKKRRRKKKDHQHEQDDNTATVVVEQQPSSDHLGLGLLEELADVDILEGGGKRKKHPNKYGRSNGVTRGKKKKKKKALMKLMLLGQFLKAKIELLLKILGAHLQIKFFAIALIGLLINIARFWIDVKRGGAPQKVVYVEHAHHQHHYEDHGEDWSESAGGGGYWKRSLQTDSPTDDSYDSATDSYQPRPLTAQVQQQHQQPYDAQYMAYRNQWQRK